MEELTYFWHASIAAAFHGDDADVFTERTLEMFGCKTVELAELYRLGDQAMTELKASRAADVLFQGECATQQEHAASN